jgi:5-methyltetrahydrofolate--homocysteine methyltransferase
MPRNLLDRLRQPGVLIGDGATGTMLQSMGLPPGAAPEEWILNEPAKIRALHEAYVEAGSDVILTCTFGGSRPRLIDAGLGDHIAEINRCAAELAREAADASGRPVFVAGDIGPIGQLMEPMGPLSYVEAVEAFAEQAAALAAGGADLIHIETMSNLSEIKAAVEGVRQVTDLPIFATMSFDTHGRTIMGVLPVRAAEVLLEAGATAVGANCGRGLEEMEQVMREMRAAFPDAYLVAKPNAGLPRLEGTRVVYDLGPVEFASYASKFVDLGIKVIGGCCGSTPDHIRAVKRALIDRQSEPV